MGHRGVNQEVIGEIAVLMGQAQRSYMDRYGCGLSQLVILLSCSEIPRFNASTPNAPYIYTSAVFM